MGRNNNNLSCNTSDGINIGGIMVACTFLCLTLSISFLFIKSYQKHLKITSDELLSTPGKICSITMLISGIILIITFAIYFINCLTNNGTTRIVFNGIVGIMWPTHVICMLFVYLYRLHVVFNDTIFAYNKSIFIVIIIGVILSGLCFLGGLIFASFVPTSFGYYIAATGSGTFIILTIIVVVLFVNGLHKVEASVNTPEPQSQQLDNDNDNPWYRYC